MSCKHLIDKVHNTFNLQMKCRLGLLNGCEDDCMYREPVFKAGKYCPYCGKQKKQKEGVNMISLNSFYRRMYMQSNRKLIWMNHNGVSLFKKELKK